MNRKILAGGIVFALVLLAQAYLVEKQLPGGGVLNAFLQAIIALAILWNIRGSQQASLEGHQRMDRFEDRIQSLNSHVESISSNIDRKPALSLGFWKGLADTKEITAVQINPKEAYRVAKQQTRRPGIALFGGLRLDMPDPLKNPDYQAQLAAWNEVMRGIRAIEFGIRNGGEIGADRVEVFMEVPAQLRPRDSCPPKPQENQWGGLVDVGSIADRGKGDLELRNADSEVFQARWVYDHVNPDVTSRLDTLFVLPHPKDAEYELPYSITSKSGVKAKGKLILKVKAA